MATDRAPIKSFRDLVVWQRGMEIARQVYRETDRMPRAELFALTNQMRRAASSIPMNVAEGFGKHSRQEFIRGLRIAVGSLLELMTAYEIATSLGMIKESHALLAMLGEEDRLLAALIRKLEAKTKSERSPKRNRLRTRPLDHLTTRTLLARPIPSISIVSSTPTRKSSNSSGAVTPPACSSLNRAACVGCWSR